MNVCVVQKRAIAEKVKNRKAQDKESQLLTTSIDTEIRTYFLKAYVLSVASADTDELLYNGHQWRT